MTAVAVTFTTNSNTGRCQTFKSRSRRPAKSLRSNPAISVVIATGHGTFEFARRSIHRDVVDFLTKPIPLSDLERALDRAWSRHVLVQTPVSKLLLPRVSNDAVEEPPPDEAAPAWLTTRKSLNIDVLERELIMEALRRSGDNRKMAADMLGMSERKLYYRLTQYRVS